MGHAQSAVVAAAPEAEAPVEEVPPAGPAGEDPPSLAGRAVGLYRTVMKFLGQRALARATLAVPRTLRFIGTTALSGEVSEAVPAPTLTLGLAAGVAMDEAVLAMAMAPSRFPRRADFARVSTELGEARRMFSRRGWIARPESYHRAPPVLAAGDVETSRGWALGLNYERITYDSGYSPRVGEPGRERWMGFEPNHRAAATILRHRGGPRPWVVCAHGFCMGYPFMDFKGLDAARLHNGLGLNVAMPVLPLHGPRKVTLVSGEPFLSFDMMNTVHGMTQAVWDLRRLVSWIREQGATSIGLYGVSLGAHVIALLAGIEEGFDAVVAGVPVVDFPALYNRHSPVHIRARAIEHDIIGGVAEDVFRVISPLSFELKVPRGRRFVFAGYGDRLVFPEQAQRLWEHWDEPRICWYPGNHVGYLWSSQVQEFLNESLTASGLSCTRAADEG